MANTLAASYKLKTVTFLFPPHLHPTGMCARFFNVISLFNHGEGPTEHKKILDENH